MQPVRKPQGVESVKALVYLGVPRAAGLPVRPHRPPWPRSITVRTESPRWIAALLLACSALPAFAEGQPPSAAGAQSAAFQLVQDGVRIDAGSLGTFTLDWPAPGPGPQHTYALVEKRISGDRASLRFERGAIDLTLGTDGTV